MASINFVKNLHLPSVSQKYDRCVQYLVGYYVGSSFHVCRYHDSFERALLDQSSRQECDSENQYYLFEIRNEIFLVL